MDNIRKDLIFWFDQPPKVSKGAYNFISKHWGSKVWYIAMHDFPDNRKASYSDESDYGAAEFVMLSQRKDPKSFVIKLIDDKPEAVHILNGFHSESTKLVYKYLKGKYKKIALVTERPVSTKKIYSPKQFFKNIGLYVKYSIDRVKYNKEIAVLMPLGVTGKNLMLRYGWPEEKVYPFMYCPIYAETQEDIIRNNNSDLIRFLYVGRFNRLRSMDLLMSAFNRQKNKNWHLDLVGGYGDMADEVISWAENHPNVSFLGRWPSRQVGKNMKNYDVYVLPTKNDGWNAQLNEVINAGIGAITTNEAVSDELISASGAGMVIPAADEEALFRAIETVLNHPDLVREWKIKANKYKSRIQGDVVGKYFMNILDNTFYGSNELPHCPWLDN